MNCHSIHDPAAVEAARRRAGIEPEALRGWRAAFFRRHASWEESLATLPAGRRAEFAAGLRPHALELVARRDSTRDRASKLAFATEDGHVLESVLMRAESGRISLCVSSQLGCPGQCAFCATGGMPFARNLTTEEILDQVVQGARLAETPLRSVVFMGMGEPLLNLANVREAVAALLSPRIFGLGGRRVMVSTCGLPTGMLDLGRAFPSIGLALSLHAARQDVRERLMPLAKRHPLPELRATLESLAGIAGREIMLEVLLLAGINDGPADAAALVEFARGLPVYVNLLAYNPIPARPHFRPAEEASYRLFAERLEEAGHKVTRRYSHGGDIAAACGQLAAGACP